MITMVILLILLILFVIIGVPLAFAIGAFALFLIAFLFAALGFRFVVGRVLSNSR